MEESGGWKVLRDINLVYLTDSCVLRPGQCVVHCAVAHTPWQRKHMWGRDPGGKKV